MITFNAGARAHGNATRKGPNHGTPVSLGRAARTASVRIANALLVLAGLACAGCTSGRAYAVGAQLNDAAQGDGDTGERDEERDGPSSPSGADAELGDDADEPSDDAQASLLSPRDIDLDEVADLLADFAYRGEGYRRANGPRFPSTVAPGKTIDMWVSAAAFDALTAVSPERSGTEVHIPAGTLIVREVYDGDTLTAITAMIKLERGSFPLGGDFWYAITDPDGTVRVDAQGAPIAGLREDCGSCHLRRSHDGFLFGTPDGYLP